VKNVRHSTAGSFIAALAITVGAASPAFAAEPAANAALPAGTGTHADLVALLQEFLEWEDPARAKSNEEKEVAGADTEVFPDYGEKAIDERRARLRAMQGRLDNMAVSSWNRRQQVDFLAVRARLNQQQFTLDVSRPWQRDPGFYVDQMLRITFTELPVKGDQLKETRRQLRAIPGLVAQAKVNLTDVAADYADLAIFNLSNPDGVEHGYPYRATPPQGVLGWYADFLGRAEKQQRDLRSDISAAGKAVEDFNAWLKEKRPGMTAKAGVGRANVDWYLRNVKLMPYDADQIVTLGKRELQRLWALYGLEQHRNRDLPPLELSPTEAEYKSRIQSTDERVRKFLVEDEIITIPEYVKELDTNVPWIVRKKGPNFWEQIQYRDPSPDHLHAVIPGHRFDGVVERHNTDPIRSKLTDGARVEGWGVYLEEGMLHAGFLDDKPRVRELIYLFGIFRAARVPADVWLQTNQMSVAEVVKYWIERTPYLDEDVARVDAEIYLRRPPGYGLGYMIGMLQMQELLADSKRQLGDKFVLKQFHDTFMAAGRIPLSLIRWEMTGLDDEVRTFWKREPLPKSSE
jgi:hypothetical protein